MKFNKKEFEKFVLSEAKKFAVEQGWIKKENLFKELTFEEVIPNNKEVIEETKKQTKEVKILAEELSRMKQLLDFRNPLLGEKNISK